MKLAPAPLSERLAAEIASVPFPPCETTPPAVSVTALPLAVIPPLMVKPVVSVKLTEFVPALADKLPTALAPVSVIAPAAVKFSADAVIVPAPSDIAVLLEKLSKLPLPVPRLAVSVVTELFEFVRVNWLPAPVSDNAGATIAPVCVTLPVALSVRLAPAPLSVSPSSMVMPPLPPVMLALMPELNVTVPAFVA